MADTRSIEQRALQIHHARLRVGAEDHPDALPQIVAHCQEWGIISDLERSRRSLMTIAPQPLPTGRWQRYAPAAANAYTSSVLRSPEAAPLAPEILRIPALARHLHPVDALAVSAYVLADRLSQHKVPLSRGEQALRRRCRRLCSTLSTRNPVAEGLRLVHVLAWNRLIQLVTLDDVSVPLMRERIALHMHLLHSRSIAAWLSTLASLSRQITAQNAGPPTPSAIILEPAPYHAVPVVATHPRHPND